MKKIISISIVLFFIFFLLFQKKEVNASYSSLKITGDIDCEENIAIIINGNNGYTIYDGKYITGDFNIEYSDGDDDYDDDGVEWIIYCGSELYEFGFDVDYNPWCYVNEQIEYKCLIVEIVNTYGYLNNNSVWKTVNNASLNYLAYQLNSYISNHPRNYNCSNTLTNGSTITLSRNCANDYFFSKLTTYFGINVYNSCGFIATATFLTYCDFFYNNNFINDSSMYSNDYCSNQAFIKCVTGIILDTSDFYMSPGYTDSFQYFLIDEIAIGDLEIGFETDDDDNPIYDTTYVNRKDIIEDYLQNYASNLSSSDYTINVLNNEEDIKNEIDSGRPVILSSNNFEYADAQGIHIMVGTSHASIAYGYKELSNGKTLFRCHMGWRYMTSPSTTHDVLLSNNGNYINGISITYTGSNNNCNDNVYLFNHGHGNCFGVCHKHSGDDYYLDLVFENPTYGYYCPVCHYRVRDHVHSLSYTYHNLYNHYVTCSCGYSGYESHVKGVGPLPNGYYKCLYCKGFMDGGNIHNKSNPPYDPRCHE